MNMIELNKTSLTIKQAHTPLSIRLVPAMPPKLYHKNQILTQVQLYMQRRVLVDPKTEFKSDALSYAK